MNSAPSSVSALHLGCGGGALQRRLIVVPQLGDAIDLDIGFRDVGAGARADDVRLHVAADAGHRMRQRSVDSTSA